MTSGHAILERLTDGLVRPDDDARGAARAALLQVGAGDSEGAGPAPREGAYGRLGEVAVWLAGAQGAHPPVPLKRALLLVLADRSRTPAEVERLAAARAGALRVLTFAATGGAGVEAVEDALRGGGELADAEADEGTDLLLLAAPAAGCDVPAAIVVAALAGLDAPSVVGADGMSDAAWMSTCVAVRNGLRRARPALDDAVALLAAAGGADLAMMTGLLLRAAARRTPVVLDGTAALAAALLAHRCAPDAADWWAVAHRDADPASVQVLRHLDLTPMLDLGLRGRPGAGAVLAVPLIQAAAALVGDGHSESAG